MDEPTVAPVAVVGVMKPVPHLPPSTRQSPCKHYDQSWVQPPAAQFSVCPALYHSSALCHLGDECSPQDGQNATVELHSMAALLSHTRPGSTIIHPGTNNPPL